MKFMVYDWLMNNIDRIIQAAVAVGTLSLAIITYLQMRENYVKDHNSELKEVLKKWLQWFDRLLKVKSESPLLYTDNAGHLEGSQFFVIEKNALFNDIFHHVPNLKDTWRNFKNLIYDFDKNREELIEKIDEYIKQKGFNYCDLSLGYNTQDGSSKSIYVEAVCLTKGKKSEYDYRVDEPPPNFIRYFGINKNSGHDLTIAILPSTQRDKVEEIKTEHKKLIEECKVKYIKEIEKIIEIEGEIKASYDNLKSILEKNDHKQRLDHMNCEYLPKFVKTFRDAI